MLSRDLWSKEVFKSYCSKVKQLYKILSSSHQWHTMSDFYGDMQDETDVWVILGELSCFQKIDMTLSFYVIPLNFRRPNIIFFFAYNCYYNICSRHTIRLVKAKLRYTGKKKITSKVFLKVRILRMKKCESEGFSHSPRLPSCHREKRWKIKDYRVVVYHLPILT